MHLLTIIMGFVLVAFACTLSVRRDDNVYRKLDHRHANLRQERLFKLNFLDYLWDMTSSLGELSISSSGNSASVKSHKCRCKCGVSNERNSRLLGGTDLAPFEFPWLVNIHVKTVSSVPGTLINERYVLTAASTMKGLTPFDVKVAIGLHDICHADVTSTIYSVSTIILHPEFSTKSRQNDISLVRLSENVQFGGLVSPICLPAAGTDDRYENLVVTIATWIKELKSKKSLKSRLRTTTYNISLTSCFPRKVGLPVLDVSTCLESAPKTQSCLGVVGAPSVLCKHDAGSGVIYRTTKNSYVLIGILSDLQRCGYPIDVESLESIYDYSLPMFTRVANHMPWIRHNIKDACTCSP